MRLYDYGPSQNGWKIRELLRRLGRAHETIPVAIFAAEGQTEAFLAMNPTGQVPVLVLDDGTVVAESNAILVTLAQGTPLFPDTPAERALALRWLFWEQNALEPNIGSLRHWTLTGKLAARDPAVIAARLASAQAALGVFERGLGARRFAVSDTLCIADIALYAYGHAAGDAGLSLDPYPKVKAWTERVRADHGPLCPVIPYDVDPNSRLELP